MIALAAVGSVIAALELLSHSEVAKLVDHAIAEDVKIFHGKMKRFHNKLWHKHKPKDKDHGVQS